MPVGRASDSMMVPTLSYSFYLARTGTLSSIAWPTGVQLVISFTSDFQRCCLAVQGSPTVMEHVVSVQPSSLILHGTFRELFVLS